MLPSDIKGLNVRICLSLAVSMRSFSKASNSAYWRPYENTKKTRGTKFLTLWRHTLLFTVSPEITLQAMKCVKTKNCNHSSSNVNMPNFRETRETLLHAHSDNVIDDEEFVLLFDGTPLRTQILSIRNIIFLILILMVMIMYYHNFE